jgi:hypothetical protein
MTTAAQGGLSYTSPDLSFAYQTAQNFAPGTAAEVIARSQLQQLQEAEGFFAGIAKQLEDLSRTRPLTDGERGGLQHARVGRASEGRTRAHRLPRTTHRLRSPQPAHRQRHPLDRDLHRPGLVRSRRRADCV